MLIQHPIIIMEVQMVDLVGKRRDPWGNASGQEMGVSDIKR
jgi:hypothetical protein